MIGGTLYKLLRKLTGSYPVSAVTGGVFIVAYGVMTGLSGATLRAVVMLLVSIGADVAGRRYDGLSAISLALFLMLIRNPYQITQVGFLLSFGAVLGIVLIQPIWKLWIPKLPRWMDGLCVSISVQLVLTPIMLYFFYEIPVYSIWLNVIVVPMMNALLAMLILCGILGGCSIELAAIPAKLADVIFSLYEWLCRMSEQLPGHTMCTGKPEMWWVFAYYMLLGLVVWLAYQCKKKQAIAGMLLLVGMFGAFFLPTNPLICMLDVGQGDGIYIRTKNRQHILVDGGSSSEKSVGKYVLKNGLKYHGAVKIDYAFVSHIDSDHYSGIEELLAEDMIEIDNLVLPAISNPDSAYKELEELAGEKGCCLYYMKKGDVLRMDGMQFTCLNPLPQAYDDKNAGSIVLQMNYGKFDLLLTGDLDASGEQTMLQDIAGAVEVLKVAHHGSASSSSEVFLHRIRPEIACISVGESNQYGHPADEVMDRLSHFAQKIYLTKDCGAITIETDGNEYRIHTFAQ